MTTSSNHLTYRVADHYPVSQFQELSKKVGPRKKRKPVQNNNNTRPSPSSNGKKKGKVSPREEIYKSMLREIKNEELGNMDSLVHKASGILRFQHYHDLDKNRKFSVSWDIDGRRVVTFEDEEGKEKSKLQRQTSMDKSRKSTLWNSLNEPVFGLDSMKKLNLTALSSIEKCSAGGGSNNNTSHRRPSTKYDESRKSMPVSPQDFGDTSGSKFSKVWEHYINTGDASKLWETKEAIFAKDSKSPSVTSCEDGSDKKSFINDSIDNLTLLEYGASGNGSKYALSDKIYSWQASASSVKNSNKQTRSKNLKGKRERASNRSKPVKEAEEKVERVQHICVVNGSVVTFKDFGFENFTNWFGDETMLEVNQQRAQPKFHLELDLTEVNNKDIKIRLLEGYKLEVEACRRLEGTLKSIRLKDILLLPKGQKPEDLLLCRTKTGKLVVEDITTATSANPSTKSSLASISRVPSSVKSKPLKTKTKWRLP